MIQYFFLVWVAATYLMSGILLFELFQNRGPLWFSVAIVFPMSLVSMIIVQRGTPPEARTSLRAFEALASRAANKWLMPMAVLHMVLFGLTFGVEFMKDAMN